jgi:hypothetical protein
VRGAHFLRLFRTLARRRVSFIGVIEAGWRSLGSPGNPIFLQAWTDVNGEEVPDFLPFLNQSVIRAFKVSCVSLSLLWLTKYQLPAPVRVVPQAD